MRKTSVYAYLFLAIALFGVWSSSRYGEALRTWVAAWSAPLWQRVAAWRPLSEEAEIHNEIAWLRSENHHLRQLVQQELVLLEQLVELQRESELTEATERHRYMLTQVLARQLEGISARVVYRSPAAWNSSLWLNVGTSDNTALGRTVVAASSPVLKEGAVVGVVDYVGEKQCRVRLLSDAGLTPSVRAARGAWRDSWLAQQALRLQRQLSTRDDVLSSDTKEEWLTTLNQLVHKLQDSSESWLLAKGTLHGSSQPLWRLPGKSLKGTGFNYDFADEEGPARDLRTGVPAGQLSATGGIPLLKLKDLLITTGYDGIFPAGLPVAEVTALSSLGEGDYYYELEAEPCAGSLTDIDVVCVLPPVGFDSTLQPPALVW